VWIPAALTLNRITGTSSLHAREWHPARQGGPNELHSCNSLSFIRLMRAWHALPWRYSSIIMHNVQGNQLRVRRSVFHRARLRGQSAATRRCAPTSSSRPAPPRSPTGSATPPHRCTRWPTLLRNRQAGAVRRGQNRDRMGGRAAATARCGEKVLALRAGGRSITEMRDLHWPSRGTPISAQTVWADPATLRACPG